MEVPVRYGVFFFGSVEMPDVLAGNPLPAGQRRATRQQVWDATEHLIDMGVRAEDLGYDSYWLAEHHFQHEGYEIVPNSLMLQSNLVARTQRIQVGAMFNIVPQWHPLRLAEDFSTLLNLSGGRAVLGVGRGTVPRELRSLGLHQADMGYLESEEKSKAIDAHNREVFAEYMEVVRTALTNETFSYKGKFFELPPPDTNGPDGSVDTLTLLPGPLHPVEIWQAVTSPPTLGYAAEVGHGCVWWNQYHGFVRDQWERYAELYQQHHDVGLSSGAKRILVLPVHIADDHETAWRIGGAGHDEFWNLLAPFGWSRGYRGEDGKPAKPGLVPTLEQSTDQKMWAIGTPEEVAETVQFHKDSLGLEHLVIFPHFPGHTYAMAAEQMQRFREQVVPLLR
ncbi:LLM class flavin-dependent oxidoreductase [Saccharopolyspora sp. NPDC050389]|uniref:LLM class flavin-dependent oxidoreductase n=1 Tax=Saccharopolyspora sp. NPDC050389 TaxID=3155516 RepID=UPI0033D2E507